MAKEKKKKSFEGFGPLGVDEPPPWATPNGKKKRQKQKQMRLLALGVGRGRKPQFYLFIWPLGVVRLLEIAELPPRAKTLKTFSFFFFLFPPWPPFFLKKVFIIIFFKFY
jgi:hypothetical protein